MDYKYIIQLLERYWKCETSLEEEKILRTFFSQAELPDELKSYQHLFAYEQSEARNEALGKDFDQRMMSIIGQEDAMSIRKAKVYSIASRLKPFFKAAAIVAIFLTLGNAMQVPFEHDNAEYVGNVDYIKAIHGESVAMSDSAFVDSMQHSSIDQIPTQAPPAILK